MHSPSPQDFGLDEQLRFSLLQLNSWPALPDLLHDTAPHTIRICALLARKPSTGMLIPVILDIAPEVAYPVIGTLYVKGHIAPLGKIIGAPDAVDTAADRASPKLSPATGSFLGRVWLSLIAKP